MYAVGNSDVDLMKYREYMSSDLAQSQPSIANTSAGLARYRSAPNSFFASLLESGGGFADLLGNGDAYDMQFPVKQEMAAGLERESESQFSSYEENIDGVFKSSDGVGMQVQGKMTGGLARQTSSPAGFFSSLAADNGFSVMSDAGNFRVANGIDGKSNPSRRLNDHMNFSSVQPSFSRYLPQITENGNEITDPENGHLGSGNGSNGFHVPSFTNDSWNGSSLSGLKRSREGEDKLSGFNSMDSQTGDDRNYSNRLTHHMSLPKTSGEMAAIEKYLQFQQEAVPCKIRAKRGFATHPRSIAERVRRTRISDRMKKLQDLFPNMDKQTNTAEMLDLAVEYIKDLQNQVETLTGKKAKCTCSK